MRLRIALGLLAALWLLPPLLPLAQWPLKHFHREWLAAALALAACVLWLPLRGQPIVVPRSALYLLALALYVPLQGQVAQTPYAQVSIGYALYLVWAALLLIAAAGIRERLGTATVVRAISWAALMSALLAAAVGSMQAFGVPDWLTYLVHQDNDSRVRGNLQHASYYADQILLGIVAAVSLFASRALRLWALIPVLMATGFALGLAGSRLTVLVLAALPVAALGVWTVRRDHENARLLIGAVLAGVAFLVGEWALHNVPWLAQQWTRDSTLTRLPTEAGGMELRWILWVKALEGFADAPLLGVGADSFAWQYFHRLNAAPQLAYTIHSHNLFTEFLVCFGVVGTGLLVAMLTGFAWRHRASMLDAAWWPLNAMLAILLLRALLDLNLWFAHLLALFVVLLGVAEQGGVHVRSRFAGSGFAAAVAVGAVVLLVTMHDFRGMASAGTSARPGQLMAALESARGNPFFTALVDSIRADAMQVDPSGNRSQLVLNSRSMNWRPTSRMVWRQSALLAANGYPEPACRLLARAWRIYPRSAPGAHRLLARSADTPAFATLIGQLDALQAGRDADVLCAVPAITGTPR